ncbi:MAG: hypothetical protein mread185_000354 [Mycoplasmataceae bacterium]|nr:MAG: hypothetical protein mread185_000354 [Mycoplasmataceae bacterium]
MKNTAQQWLDENYPKNERKNKPNLIIDKKGLEGN